MMTYKVFYHVGKELGLKTKALRGTASLSDISLFVQGPSEVTIPLANISSVRLFRLHGLGRVIEIEYYNGRLFVSVVRFMIGQFASINFFKTGALHSQLSNVAAKNEHSDRPAS